MSGSFVAPMASLQESFGPRSIPALFDEAAMAVYPSLARLLGYTFRVGATSDLERDGKAVLATVWGAKGLLPAEDVAHFAERYDRGTTWIVCYRDTRPVGVMGLLDMRVASVALEFSRRRAPLDLDLATTREICRLAILPEHRGGAQVVMVGLLREMLAWSKANGVIRLFSGSTEKLYKVYRRYNPTARLIPDTAEVPEPPVQARYYEKLRQYGASDGVMYTFDVAGASPWNVFSRFLLGRLRRGEPR